MRKIESSCGSVVKVIKSSPGIPGLISTVTYMSQLWHQEGHPSKNCSCTQEKVMLIYRHIQAFQQYSAPQKSQPYSTLEI